MLHAPSRHWENGRPHWQSMAVTVAAPGTRAELLMPASISLIAPKSPA